VEEIEGETAIETEEEIVTIVTEVEIVIVVEAEIVIEVEEEIVIEEGGTLLRTIADLRIPPDTATITTEATTLVEATTAVAAVDRTTKEISSKEAIGVVKGLATGTIRKAPLTKGDVTTLLIAMGSEA